MAVQKNEDRKESLAADTADSIYTSEFRILLRALAPGRQEFVCVVHHHSQRNSFALLGKCERDHRNVTSE
jgi:hypothetical protein